MSHHYDTYIAMDFIFISLPDNINISVHVKNILNATTPNKSNIPDERGNSGT